MPSVSPTPSPPAPEGGPANTFTSILDKGRKGGVVEERIDLLVVPDKIPEGNKDIVLIANEGAEGVHVKGGISSTGALDVIVEYMKLQAQNQAKEAENKRMLEERELELKYQAQQQPVDSVSQKAAEQKAAEQEADKQETAQRVGNKVRATR